MTTAPIPAIGPPGPTASQLCIEARDAVAAVRLLCDAWWHTTHNQASIHDRRRRDLVETLRTDIAAPGADADLPTMVQLVPGVLGAHWPNHPAVAGQLSDAVDTLRQVAMFRTPVHQVVLRAPLSTPPSSANWPSMPPRSAANPR